MKKPLKSFLRLTALMAIGPAFFASSAAAQTILINDTLTVNFTQTGNTVGGNWNELVRDGNTPIDSGALLSNLVRFSDGQGTGVDLSIDYSDPATFGIGGATLTSSSARTFPVSGEIPHNAQTNLSYYINGATSLVFSGLDDSLTYNLSILSWNEGRNAHDWIAQPGVDQTSLSVDPTDGLVHTFSNLSTDGFGNIVLQSTTTGSGTNGQHINAIELTAIPEPAVFATIAGVLALGLVIYRRRLR